MSEGIKAKSTVTCNMEGVIETYSEGAQALFGYSSEEIVGKKRVSMFSPGWIVLQNVGGWLARAQKDGEFKTKTVFLRKDGSQFNAEIRLSPTYRDGKQIGYCGVTTEINENVQPKREWYTSIVEALVITRAPFLSASIIPAFIAGAYATTLYEGPIFSTLNFILATIGVALLHLASNMFNDYFDWKSGTDQANTAYFQQYSGGSRAIELGIISQHGTARVATMLIFVSAAIGVYLATQVGLIVLGFGLAGAFAGYFYTAPPLRLVARHGIGELAIGITFGPLITGGIFATVTGEFSWMSMLIGLPIGLLTSNILLINQVPDMEGDASTGKNHLVVTFGKENSVIIYALTVAAAVGTTLTIAFKLHNMWLILPMVLLGVYGAYIVSYFRKHVHARTLVTANVNTVQLAMLFGIAFAIAIAV